MDNLNILKIFIILIDLSHTNIKSNKILSIALLSPNFKKKKQDHYIGYNSNR